MNSDREESLFLHGFLFFLKSITSEQAHEASNGQTVLTFRGKPRRIKLHNVD